MSFRIPLSLLGNLSDVDVANKQSRDGLSWDGDKWVPRLYADAAITVTNEADTFAEAGVTVTHDDTVLSGGKLQLGTVTPGTNTTLVSGSSVVSARDRGVTFVPSEDLDGVRVTISANNQTAQWTVELRNAAGTVLASNNNAANGGTVDLVAALTAGQTYRVVQYWTNTPSTDLNVVRTSRTFPIAGDRLNVTGGANGNTTDASYVYFFTGIAPLDPILAGEATVTWTAPTSLDSWDVIAYAAAANDGAVAVDIEDTDGTVYASDVDTTASASAVPAAKNLRIRFRLSRAALADATPTVEWCARRYTR